MTDTIPTIKGQTEIEVAAPAEAVVIEMKPKRKRANATEMAAREVFDAVAVELEAQYQKWGVQDHPLQGGVFGENARAYYQKQADGWKAINDQRVKSKVIGWDGILLEETFEALAEKDIDAAVAELVQVAAVAVQAILSLKRNAS